MGWRPTPAHKAPLAFFSDLTEGFPLCVPLGGSGGGTFQNLVPATGGTPAEVGGSLAVDGGRRAVAVAGGFGQVSNRPREPQYDPRAFQEGTV